jgi:GNAT superfamily N-acetyltransferase
VTQRTLEPALGRYTKGMERTLKDGSQATIRPIQPDDKAELEAGLHRLSETSVHKRFLGPKPRFSRAELRYLTEVDGHDHVAFVAEMPEYSGLIVAVARYVRLVDEPDIADVAVVVADPLQGRGLGSALVDELAHEAVRQGITQFSATMLSENRAAYRLMTRLSQRLELRDGGAGQRELTARLVA